MTYNPKTQILTISFKYAYDLDNASQIGVLPQGIPKPPTNRSIPFWSKNVDDTITTAVLLITNNGEMIVYNSVNIKLKTPIIVGSCYIGPY